jgi:hypothetical protein
MPLLKCKRKKTEHIIQKSIVRWFKKELPEYIIFSTNNEACYTRKTYFTEAGMLNGLADLVIVLPNKIIFVELKTEKTKQSPSQKEFEVKINSLGYNYYVIRSLAEFQKLIKSNL